MHEAVLMSMWYAQLHMAAALVLLQFQFVGP